MEYPAFVGGGYESQSVTADQERTVNFFFEKLESAGATSRSALYPTPGVEQIAISAYAPGSAHGYFAGREFAVIGPKFLEVSQFGLLTDRGTVAIGENPATISYNGDGGGQLFITAGSNGYIFDLTSAVLTQITALNGLATMGDSLDGYFLALDANTSTFYASDLLDGLTWDPTMFAQRNIASDPWVSMKVNGRYIFNVGSETSEVWYDSGLGNFPFAPHPSGLIPHGTSSPSSVAVGEGVIAWAGASKIGNGYVVRATGFTPEVVSDKPLEWAMREYNLADAEAEMFNFLGHVFYRITFPTDSVTWCWDTKESRWFQWMTWVSERNEFQACRARWHAMAFGEHRMLDSETGSIYRMAASLGNDVDGRPIRRMRRAPALTAENQRVYYSSFEVDLEPGLGTSPAPGGGIQIIAGVNDYIDVEPVPGFPVFGRVPAKTYVTLNSLAAAVIKALEGTGVAVPWVCFYDVQAGRYTLGATDPYLLPPDFLLGTGAHVSKSIGPTLGFTAADFSIIKTAEGAPVVADFPGSNPTVMMRSSNDGGKTWSSERWCSAGKSGEYSTTVRWPRCGMARRRAFEVTFTDPVPLRITNAYLELGQPMTGGPRG